MRNIVVETSIFEHMYFKNTQISWNLITKLTPAHPVFLACYTILGFSFVVLFIIELWWRCYLRPVQQIVRKSFRDTKQKSRKYQGVFEVKSRVKTWQVRGIWSQQLASISKSQNGGRNQVSGRVSVPCWQATPVANAPWKPLVILWRPNSVSRSWNWWKVWLVGKHCWSRVRMSFNIRERDTSYCWIRSPYRL